MTVLPKTAVVEIEQAAGGSNIDTLVHRAVAALEEDIVFGYLHPRERLIEDDLRARFDLKRHVVRQVLLELEQMGLVERKKNVGALVKSYTIKEVLDLYATREILETSCARRIALPVAAKQLDELTDIQRRHDAAVAESDLRGAFRTNIEFHKAFFALSDNEMLTEMIELGAQRAHCIRSQSLTTPYYLEKARQEHWKIIEALQHGDRDLLVSLCSEHLVPSRDAYIEQQSRRGRLPSLAGRPDK